MAFKVYTYPKFGDHCVAYGIVKEFAKQHEHIIMYTDACSTECRNTNKLLYSSLKNVTLSDELYVEELHKKDWGIANTKIWFDTVEPWVKDLSLATPEWYNDYWKFDFQWYMNASVPFNLKWDNFFYERNIKKEKESYYDKFELKDDEEFIFMHEDVERNYIIKKEYINSNIRVINFSEFQNVNILDILYTVERAKEIHTFNTGTLTFIDLMQIKHDKLFYHKYVRPGIFEQPILRLNWKILQ